jgi:hypothetical protein
MHKLDMPAGSTIRLMATARADVADHRWEVRVYTAGSGAEPARLGYGSRIGVGDRDQRIDIPAQAVDCRLEVATRHVTAGGDWGDDRLTILDDAPGRLDLGFSDPSQPTAHDNDVLLSFALTGRPPPQA